MELNQIPRADAGVIGGSSTFNLSFPEELGISGVRVLEDGLVFATPYGDSPPFKLFSVMGDKKEIKVLTCRMHGWRRGVERARASRQVFWVLREAGVGTVLAEGGVGSVSRLLDPRDLVIPDDYLDFSMRKDVGLEDSHLLIMREALCPELRRLLAVEAKALGSYRVFERGTYAVTDGRHFESPAEVRFLSMGGADVVGQSLCPEVYLAREIGACYAGVYLVVNYGEGVVRPWLHRELEEIFYSEGYAIGQILIQTLRKIPEDKNCSCSSLRKKTLLKGVY